jgi:hypothetical protein
LRRAEVGDRVVDGRDDGAGPRQQTLSRVSERQGPEAALDKGASKSVLETGDMSRNARLGEMNPVGGPSESSGIYDLQPRTDPRNFKIHDGLPFAHRLAEPGGDHANGGVVRTLLRHVCAA